MSKWDVLLKQREDEEKKRKEYLAILIRKKEQYESELDNVKREIIKTEEYMNSSNDSKYLLIGDRYLKHLLKRKSIIEKGIENIKKDIMNARILLKQAVVDRKKVEKIIEKEKEKEKEIIMKKEQEFLDEVSRHMGGTNARR